MSAHCKPAIAAIAPVKTAADLVIEMRSYYDVKLAQMHALTIMMANDYDGDTLEPETPGEYAILVVGSLSADLKALQEKLETELIAVGEALRSEVRP